MFLTVFHSFPPFLCPRANHSCRSLLLFSSCRSLHKRNLDRIAPVSTLQKSDLERFAPIALYKRGRQEHSLFFTSKLLFCSFAHKKGAIPWKIKERIPNPEFCVIKKFIFSHFLFSLLKILHNFTEQYIRYIIHVWPYFNHLHS